MAVSNSSTRTTATGTSGDDGDARPLRELQIITVKYQCPYCERVYFKKGPALACLSACRARARRDGVS